MSFGAGGFLKGLRSGLSLRNRMDAADASESSRGSVSYLIDGLRDKPPASADAAPAGGGKPFQTNDPVSTDLPPHARAFLNAVAGGESGGKYNIRYDGGAGSTFDNFSHHPGIMARTADGRMSSAAGRYMFTKSTWDAMGGGEFTPERQDHAAWRLAQQTYQSQTGRSLDQELRSNGLTPRVMSTLGSTWEALKHNQGRHAATFSSSLSRYGSGGGSAPAYAPQDNPSPAPGGALRAIDGAFSGRTAAPAPQAPAADVVPADSTPRAGMVQPMQPAPAAPPQQISGGVSFAPEPAPAASPDARIRDPGGFEADAARQRAEFARRVNSGGPLADPAIRPPPTRSIMDKTEKAPKGALKIMETLFPQERGVTGVQR